MDVKREERGKFLGKTGQSKRERRAWEKEK